MGFLLSSAATIKLGKPPEDWYFEQLKGLPPSQRVLARALAAEPVREFSAEYRERHALGVSSTVHTAVRISRADVVNAKDYCGKVLHEANAKKFA